MDTIYSFWSLISSDKYIKIEIPILQRDYAQGRKTPEIDSIRKSFSSHLINALCNKKHIELDFVYGSVEHNNVFVPLDGQQRLTTLFLLHWYLAAKELKIETSVMDRLLKFSYETRPSAHDFCRELILQGQFSNNLNDSIPDSIWYNDEWNNDPTVVGMLTMLETIQKNELINAKYDDSLFDRLTNDNFITFYFVTLEKYGLTEDLYIRMNARGKMLNDFENFKSEFYKIISIHTKQSNEFKDKIEYEWVTSLWDFREKDKYIVDAAFMHILRFVSEMLYFKQSLVRADSYEKFGKADLTNLEVLKNVFSQEDNLDFLIFVLDSIPQILNINQLLLWEKDKENVSGILKTILTGGSIDVTAQIILYSTFRYFYLKKEESISENYLEFIRIIRNLTYNTKDKSRREWAKLLSSIEQFILDVVQQTTIEYLSNQSSRTILDGFYVPQREEEILKAQIVKFFPQSRMLIEKAEANTYLRGNIINLTRAAATLNNDNLIDYQQLKPTEFNDEKIQRLEELLKKYEEISLNDFTNIWGDLIISEIYSNNWGRIVFVENYEKHDAMFNFLLSFNQSKLSLESYILSIEKEFIIKKYKLLESQLIDLSDYKDRLYLYFILSRRIMNLPINQFFRKGYNFGWLEKEKGFKSIFDKEGEKYNPIFQTYTSQFRYNLGLQINNAIPPEIVDGRPHKPFEKLYEWAIS